MDPRRYPRRLTQHYRFRLLKRVAPPDFEIAEKGIEAMRAGILFAQENFLSSARVHQLAAQQHREMGCLRRLSQGSHPTFLFLQSAFGHAMAWAIFRSGTAPLAARRRARRVHVLCFRKLVASLLSLSPVSRDRLWKHAERLSPSADDNDWMWEVLFSGAIGVARTAYALLQLDLLVYAPTVFEKLALDLDLLCAVPDGKQGLALRIRSDGAKALSTYAALTHHPSLNGFAHRPDLLQLWDATAEFNWFYHVEWTGVDLVVGLRGEMASGVERALSPHILIWNDLAPTLLPNHPALVHGHELTQSL